MASAIESRNSSADISRKENDEIVLTRSTSSESGIKNRVNTDGSISIVAAVHKKYSASAMKASNCVIFMTPNAPGKTSSGNFRVPNMLILNSFKISVAGEKKELSDLCENVVELDLTDNNLRSWEEIFSVLECIPKLEFLNLTRNPLMQLDHNTGHRFPKLKKLALNFTDLNWNTIHYLLDTMPNLEELYLSGNQYDDVLLEIDPYSSLQLLQLTSNSLNMWSSVVKIDRVFPNLKYLTLADNGISQCGCAVMNGDVLKNLITLNMNNTKIDAWNELDKLGSLKALDDIRLASIPLLEPFEEIKRRQLLSVYFPHVQRLNGSTMTDSDRETAERVFIRHFMDQDIKPDRFNSLEAKHGKLQPLVNVNMTPKETIEMTIICEERVQLFDIPAKQTISQLRRSLKSFTGTARFRLFHKPNDYSGPVYLLRNSNRLLYALNFRDGDQLICQLDEPVSPRDSDTPSPDGSVPSSPTKEPPTKRR